MLGELDMLVKIDLHIHTLYSDGSSSVREVLRMARMAGLHGIAITDHNTSIGYFRAKSMVDGDFIVIPGFEASTTAGHILVIGVPWFGPSSRARIVFEYESLIERVRDLGGIAILAHPATCFWNLSAWRKYKPDAVEVLNSLYPFSKLQMKIGLKIARELGLPCTAGSDSHISSEVGRAFSIVEVDELRVDDVIESIRRGKVAIAGGFSPITVRVRSGLGYFYKRIANMLFEL